MAVPKLIFTAVLRCVFICGVLLCCLSGCRDEQPGGQTKSEAEQGGTPAVSARPETELAMSASLRQEIEVFCGDCHRMPSAEYFARDSWYAEVERGFRFYTMSERTDLKVPPKAEVVRYFRQQAPERLTIPVRPQSDPGPVTFRQQVIPAPPDLGSDVIAVSFLDWFPGENAKPSGRLQLSDMRGGHILALDVDGSGADESWQRLVTLENPARFARCDLDHDGRMDFVVGDLGSFMPEDHQKGRVVWLRRRGATWESIVLKDAIGRVADVRVADFNEDGLLDVLVGEFGWITTGAIRLMVQQPDQAAASGDVPAFETRLLDKRHGVIHTPVLDWNGDAHPDFLALISQEYETVEVFENDGTGRFENRVVHPPEDPSTGSSGIEPVDLDGDGDLDVLYTNGDTFDSFDIKFFHGVHWLENRGAEGFVAHRLATMPGVHRALPGDLDGDGDLDVVAVSFLPKRTLEESRHSRDDFDAVVWLEQVQPGRFTRHSLEVGTCIHACCQLGDFDSDGDLDFAVGNFLENADLTTSPLTIWWNETRPGR